MTNPTPHGQVPASSAVLKAIREANMQLVRTGDDDAYMLLPYLQAHVQNPAEIEHAAGDVSKNGAEVNMAYAELPTRYYLVGGVEKAWDHQQMRDFADATHALRASHGQAPAGATNTKTHELLSTTVGLLMGYLEGAARKPYKPGSVIDKTVAEAVEHLKDWPYPEPTPPTQAADSVLEDVARLDWLEQNIFHREMDEWDSRVGGRGNQSMWVLFAPKGVQGSARKIIDAARKQGGQHG